MASDSIDAESCGLKAHYHIEVRTCTPFSLRYKNLLRLLFVKELFFILSVPMMFRAHNISIELATGKRAFIRSASLQ